MDSSNSDSQISEASDNDSDEGLKGLLNELREKHPDRVKWGQKLRDITKKAELNEDLHKKDILEEFLRERHHL